LAFFILAILPFVVLIFGMNLSKEIDQNNLDYMLSFKEELKIKSKEIG